MAREKKPPLNPRDFYGQSDQYILETVTDDINRWKRYSQTYIEKMQEYYNDYQSQLDSNMVARNKQLNRASLYIPYIYSTIETAIPKIVNAIWDSKPLIVYRPVAEDAAPKADIMTNLVDFYMTQKMGAATVFYDLVKGALIYGTAITKQSWDKQERKMYRWADKEHEVEIDDEDNEGKKKKVKTKKKAKESYNRVMYDAPKMDYVNLSNFFFDPAFTTIDAAPFCGQMYYEELWRIKQKEKEGIYKNTKYLSGTDINDLPRDTTTEKGMMRDGVKIWEYWTNEWVVVIANETTVIRCDPNPYHHGRKPYVKWEVIPMPNEFYGKSTVETLQDLQRELNTIRMQRRDNINMALNRQYTVTRDSDIMPENMVSRPNNIIFVNTQEDVKALETPDVTSSAYQEEQVVKGDMDVVSGIHSYDRGQEPARQDTATVASLLTSASSERFRLQAMCIEEDSMTELGFQLAELVKQFMTEGPYIKIEYGSDFEKALREVDKEMGTNVSAEVKDLLVTPEDIDAEYDVIATGSASDPTVNREVRQSQLIQLFGTLQNVPGLNLPMIAEQLFKEFGFKNASDFIMEEQPMEAPPAEEPQEFGTPMGGVGGEALMMQNPNVQF